MRIPLLLCLFVVSFVPSFSQSNTLLPVRIKFKNAFIDTSGQVKIQTRYDHLGDINLPWYGQEQSKSGYFLAEVGGKVGLVDSTLKEVLAPAWQEVHPVNDDVFLVSPRINFYTAVDRSGRDLLGSLYHQIEFPDQGKAPYFIVRKDGKCGVIGKNGVMMIPVQYPVARYIEAGKGFFKVKNSLSRDSLWTLLSADNKPVLKKPQFEIRSGGEHYFATNDYESAGRWIVRDTTGVEKTRLPFVGIDSFIGLNRHVLGYRYQSILSKKFALYVFATKKVELTDIDSIWALDERFVLARIKNRINLIDSLGNRVELDSGLVDMKSGAGKLFRVRCAEGKWGLFSLDEKRVLACQYDYIDKYEGRFAKCTKNRRAGAVDRAAKEVVPVQYDWVKIEGDIVEAYQGNQIFQYEFDQKGRSNLFGPFKYQEYRIAYSGLYYEMEDFLDEQSDEDVDSTALALSPAEAPPAPETKKIAVKELLADETGQIKVGDDLCWVLTGDGYILSRLISDDGKKTKAIRQDLFKKLLWIKELNWTLAVHRADPANNALSQALEFSTGISRMEIFDNTSGEFVQNLPILGVRLSDFKDSLPFAAFIDVEGRMGLIDRSGKQATGTGGAPLRFDYIGKVNEGKIRVCVRGAFRAMAPKEDKTFKLTTTRGFLNGFLIQKLPAPNDKNMKNKGFVIEAKSKAPPLWGYIDVKGQTLIEPVYDFVNDFKDSSAINMKNKKWGVVDHQNKVIIPFKYDLVRPDSNYWRTYLLNAEKIYYDVSGLQFPDSLNAQMSYNPEGLFVCKDTNGLYGYADALMQIKIPGRFKQARYFSEGLAAVKDQENHWVFIDTTGKIVVRPALPNGKPAMDVGEFNEGLCWIKEGAKKKCGYIDRTGNLVIEPKYEKAFNFKDSVAIVGVGFRDNHKRGLIDRKGQYLLLPGTYTMVFPFNSYGFIRVCEPYLKHARTAEGRDTIISALVCGMMNTTGDLVVPVRFEKIITSEEGFAVQDTASAYWGFYDSKGNMLTGLDYKDASEISQGLSVVGAEERMNYVYLDVKTGKSAYGFMFKKASPFYDSYAEVSRNIKDDFGSSIKIIDIQGEFVNIPYGVRFYREGRVGAFQLEKKGPKEEIKHQYFLTPEGISVYHRRFANINPFADGIAMVVPHNTMGVLNSRGLMVIPPKYTTINRQKLKGTNHLSLMVKPKYKRGLYTKQGKLIVEPDFDRLSVLDNGLLRTEWGDEIGYLRLRDGAWIWPMQR